MTRIKICGLSKIEDALAAAEAGADFLGMVFAPSRRQVTAETASEILAVVRNRNYRLKMVGVFVNASAEQVNSIAAGLQLDWVQLSGDESWDYCLGIEKPLIKVIHVLPHTTSCDILAEIERGSSKLKDKPCQYLLDTGRGDKYGGTGTTFNWQVAKDICARFPVIIAGGLDSNNVISLIKETSPWGVDVSSGIETEGCKDTDKIRRFIASVRTVEYNYDHPRMTT